MYIKFFILSLSIMLLFLSGCTSSKKMVVAQKKELPSWYENPPKSTTETLYALGYGEDKKSATTNALSNMLSKLSVAVSSKFSAKTIAREGSITSTQSVYTDEQHSEVKKTRISNYEIVQSSDLGFKKYAVLVKSDKKKLFESMFQEIQQEFQIIKNQQLIVKKQNPLKQIAFYKKTYGSLATLPYRLTLISELNKSFDGRVYIEKRGEVYKIYQDLLSNITFSLHSNKNAMNLKAVIVKGISSKQFHISHSKGKKHFRVYVNSSIEKADSYGFTLARSAINIKVKDYRGRVVGSNKLNITGQSTQGYAIAKENVAIKLNKLIEEEGISRVLGLKLN